MFASSGFKVAVTHQKGLMNSNVSLLFCDVFFSLSSLGLPLSYAIFEDWLQVCVELHVFGEAFLLVALNRRYEAKIKGSIGRNGLFRDINLLGDRHKVQLIFCYPLGCRNVHII